MNLDNPTLAEKVAATVAMANGAALLLKSVSAGVGDIDLDFPDHGALEIYASLIDMRMELSDMIEDIATLTEG
jgi:hypothetical protein